MRVSGALLPMFVLAGATLAGCADTQEVTGTQLGTDPVRDDLGVVAGQVTSRELTPLADARVTADELEATTDEVGHFLIQGLRPGPTEIVVEADGYFRATREVQVRAGETAELYVTLDDMPSDAPYTAVYILAGYSTCEYSLFLAVSTIDSQTGSCPLGEPKRNVIQAVPDSWRYGVVELVWETQDSFALYIADDMNCLTSDPCYGIKFGGRAPLRLDMAPGDVDLAARWASDGEITYPEGAWEMWANVLYVGMYRDEWGSVTDDPVCRQALNYSPGCPSWGVSTGIRFETYVSIFNWERPAQPELYTALPDE